ncbi:MAG: cation:dicarboxylase symporter family transporter [Thermodesulfobacteriota bacterium]
MIANPPDQSGPPEPGKGRVGVYPPSRRFGWLLRPWAILAGMALGVLIGQFDRGLTRHISVFGELYLAFLRMCVLPMVLVAVTYGVGRLMTSRAAARYLFRIVVVFLVALVAAAVLGTAAALVLRPGSNLSRADEVRLGEMVVAYEATSQFAPSMEIGAMGLEVQEAPRLGLLGFILSMIPPNIFQALSEASYLSVLFFSAAVGLAVGFFSPAGGETVFNLLYGLYMAFKIAVGWAMYLLPFGVGCLLASLTADLDYQVVATLGQYGLTLLVAAAAFMLLNGVIFRLGAGIPFLKSFFGLRKPLSIALGTADSLATLPSALRSLDEELGLDEKTMTLVTPLSLVVCRFGMVMNFAAAAVFFSQINGMPLGPEKLVLVVTGAIIAGLASINAPGPAAYTLLPLVFDPLGLPYEPALLLLIALHPAAAPLITLVNVHTSCAAAAVVGRSPES